jgi:hypothetical protein
MLDMTHVAIVLDAAFSFVISYPTGGYKIPWDKYVGTVLTAVLPAPHYMIFPVSKGESMAHGYGHD